MMLPPPKKSDVSIRGHHHQHHHQQQQQQQQQQQKGQKCCCCCGEAGLKASMFLLLIILITAGVIYWLYANNLGKKIPVNKSLGNGHVDEDEIFLDLDGNLRPMSELDEVKRKNRQIEDFYFKKSHPQGIVIVKVKEEADGDDHDDIFSSKLVA